MPNIGPLEIAIVAIIALVIFGPKRLPELGHGLGRGMREFKAGIIGKDGPSDDKPADQVAAAPTVPAVAAASNGATEAKVTAAALAPEAASTK